MVQNASIVRHLITLLERAGGSASYVRLSGEIFKLDRPDPWLTRKVLEGLLQTDPRFELGSASLALKTHRSELAPLNSNTYVVVDVETTGISTPSARITELAMVKVRRGRIIDELVSLVNPGTTIPESITALTGITNDMVRRAPTFQKLAAKALKFAGESVIVAHNAQFDLRFLDTELDRAIGAGFGLPSICTLQTARRIIHGLPNYQLQSVAAHYQIEIDGRHRAAGDARATAQIWLRMLKTLEAYGVPSLSVARNFRLFPSHSLI